MKLSADVVIERPPAVVFDFVATHHHTNHPRWDPTVVRVEPLEPGAPGLGTGFRMTRRMGRREDQFVFRFTGWQIPTSMAYASETGPVDFRAMSWLEPVGSQQTKLVFQAEAHPQGARALLTPLLRGIFARRIRSNLFTIKELVEAEA